MIANRQETTICKVAWQPRSLPLCALHEKTPENGSIRASGRTVSSPVFGRRQESVTLRRCFHHPFDPIEFFKTA